MFILEGYARLIRNLPVLEKINFFWDFIRPAYEYSLKIIYGDLLQRKINNIDVVYLPYKFRHFGEEYEVELWKRIMREVRIGDVIADVGAFLGFYTFGFAKRAGPGGKVIAFEPDPYNFTFLKDIVKRYTITSGLNIMGLAVGDIKGRLSFTARSNCVSAVVSKQKFKQGPEIEVDCITLDDFFANEKLDIIKIDVEGYEEKVLLGARNILKRKSGFPRAIYIEVHPYVWKDYATTDRVIISILKDAGYRIENLSSEPISSINEYGEIIARRD